MTDNFRSHVQRELTRFTGLAEESGDTALVVALLRAKMEIADAQRFAASMPQEVKQAEKPWDYPNG